MKVLITEPEEYSQAAVDIYRCLGPVCFGDVPGTDVGDISLLVVGLGRRLNSRFLDRFPALRAIASPTTAVTHIDIRACEKRGIQIFSLADCRTEITEITSTSELTMGLIIALLRGIPASNRSVVAEGIWDRRRYKSRQLSCLTLGIVGLGRIGGHLAGYGRAFGMEVVASDPWQPESRFRELGVRQCDLHELLEAADIISIHADLRPDNENLLDDTELDRLPPDALVVNTARGALLNERAAADRIRNGRIGGIAVDVLACEHNDGDAWSESPLVLAAREGHNVIITPHIGGCTMDAMRATEEFLARHVVGVMTGNDLGAT